MINPGTLEAIEKLKKLVEPAKEASANPRRCPSRHRDAESLGAFIFWCPECGAIKYIGEFPKPTWPKKRWQYPTQATRGGDEPGVSRAAMGQ